MSEKREYTTVAVDERSAKFIETMAKAAGVSKKEFITLSMNYFMRNGINPIEHETPTAEIAKITKRFDQFFAFFKKQETTLILPMANTIIKENTDLKAENLELKNQLQAVINTIGNFVTSQKNRDDEFVKVFKAIIEKEDKILESVNNKKTGLFGK